MSLLALKPRSLTASALVAGGVLVWSSLAVAQNLPGSFADLAERVSPAVVNITATHSGPTPGAPQQEGPRGFRGPSPFPEGSPFEEFFRQFEDRFGDMFRMPERQQFQPQQFQPQQFEPQQFGRPGPRTGVGSGFIIDAEGFVVTNNHVIDGADDIRVRLSDGRDYPAELVGTDPQTDVALLKVAADDSLPTVDWGDSDAVRVGDWVLAVGNPFGLGGSVTAGIVSARGRDIHAGPYDDFIQTDAAINRGNSGGPMFDLEGQVIGINTAIYSPSGGSIGIGFAIPSSIARDVVEQLRDGGEVERGWLGVRIQEVTPELAEALGLEQERGALVASVQSGSPASEAGLRARDVVVRFDGQEVTRMRDLPRLVASVRAGRTVEVEVWRDGAAEALEVTIERQTAERMAALAGEQGSGGPEQQDERPSERLGARLSGLDDQERERFGIPSDLAGVVISDIDPEGRAASQGLRVGDVIEEVDGTPVTRPDEVEGHLSQAQEQGRKAVVLLLNRGGDPLFFGLKLDA